MILSIAARLKSSVSLDALLGGLLALAGFYAYHSTLAPTVLEGDAALFQYTPHVLGVTYPTGYPLYILLGKLWITLLPVGEIAWRMNLLSALCSALALPLIYGAARRLLALPGQPNDGPARWGALLTALLFATLPTFWRWSTEAKIYALNILLFSALLYSLTGTLSFSPPKKLVAASRTMLSPGQALRLWPGRYPLALPVLLLGLQISVHSTTVLLIPGLLLFAWLHLRPHLFTKKRFVGHTLLLALPGLLYFYVPLRAEWLIARHTRFEAIGRGLLADFYHSGLAGLVRYFTAADFTGGVVTNWGLLPQQFGSVYLPILADEFTWLGIGLAVVGGLAYAVRQPRRFLPLFLLYAAPIPFVLTYGQGEQSAFLLPSFLIFSIFAGYSLTITARLSSRFIPGRLTSQLVPPVLLLGLIPLLFLPQVEHNYVWLSRKWTRAIYNEWTDALSHPLEPGAGMLAHWGDLTSFWYMQHAEGLRPDLRGVYPPNEAAVVDWFERGSDHLYIAGPLQGWAAGIEERYRLMPWGRLVRLAPRGLEPVDLLPALPPVQVTFDDRLRLLGAEFAPQAVSGQEFPVTFTWHALADLAAETTLSLRLVQNDIIVAQLDDRLRSGWFPSETMPAGQYLLSYPLLPVPVGTLPGPHRLQLVIYQQPNQPWPTDNGDIVLDLGPVDIAPPPPDYQPNLRPYKLPPAHDFNGEIELVGYDYSVSRVGQGKGFALRLLWQARRQPVDNYTLRVELVDAAGDALRQTDLQPVDGRAQTASWQLGQFIRDQVDLVVPASAPPGDGAVALRLSWLRPNGSALDLRRWYLPAGQTLTLDTLQVTEKEGRMFDAPRLQFPLNYNFENKVRLLGFDFPDEGSGDDPVQIQIEQTACAAGQSERCAISLNVYWQALSEMAQPYRVFLHVIDDQGQIVAQHDRIPGERGKQPTTAWLPGEVVQDPITVPLPAAIAPGQYHLRLGLYQPPTGPRLAVVDEAEQPLADFIEIGRVQVTAR